MTIYTISWKQSYHEGTNVYRGDMRGFVDTLRGMLSIESVQITGIQIEDEGEGQ